MDKKPNFCLSKEKGKKANFICKTASIIQVHEVDIKDYHQILKETKIGICVLHK